jgi:hypothetical protein
MDWISRDYRVLQLLEEQEFVVYEAVGGALLPERYSTKSAALWAAVAHNDRWRAEVRAASASTSAPPAAHNRAAPADNTAFLLHASGALEETS